MTGIPRPAAVCRSPADGFGAASGWVCTMAMVRCGTDPRKTARWNPEYSHGDIVIVPSLSRIRNAARSVGRRP
ncbi:MAG TPA: hypothetical protein VM779_09705 [Thermoanaerobaculia bacterium]|nr:hypothetical protein [Thermoanaerobaculia bacterium]